MERTMLIFVSGGARSGKSMFAEQLVLDDDKCSQFHYIATSTVTDPEMKQRISFHRESRGDGWVTWEQPVNIHEVKDNFLEKDCILLDCLTILTANELFQGGTIHSAKAIYYKILDSIQQLQHVKKLVIVSNDLFSGRVPNDEGTFTYMKLLGSLHQEIVRMADQAYQVNLGIPKRIKG
jgi:adenosylcobinamide kinase/adenosylcobinamide-phosphate guanylyltransferase